MDQPGAPGLYDPAFERDSCGFGLLADLHDRPARALVADALAALARLAHRGAVGADGRSGDGCGLLVRRPEAFLRAVADEAGIAPGPRFAAGTVFLPRDPGEAAQCRETLAAALRARGLEVAGWRRVPTDPAACGPIALAGVPRVEQVFVRVAASARDAADVELDLFLARRHAEQALAAQPAFHVVTLSAASLGYKGMVLPARPTCPARAARWRRRGRKASSSCSIASRSPSKRTRAACACDSRAPGRTQGARTPAPPTWC